MYSSFAMGEVQKGSFITGSLAVSRSACSAAAGRRRQLWTHALANLSDSVKNIVLVG